MTSEEVKLKKNIQSAKSSKLQEVSLDFKRKQRSYLNKLQKNTSSSIGWTEDSDSDTEPAGVGFTIVQTHVVTEMEEEVAKRDREIKQIVKSIEDLSSIVHDISTLVIKQGTLMDQIEYNLDQTEDALTGAVVELKETNELQKGYRNRLCILLVLVVLVITMVFVAIIKAFI
ncbi:t-SNARE family protein [Heterostelium album PN500]|uniref:t-SNARE family protein n=1 Tax=Heterostelium pallidum (strain ATCC 26659 / Pp 5 / PN500) TaxID=670386 RepID=D3BRT3_HETP5|nr:t-SNARE family protein [Heterostelium album PN500]EFA76115.1 t-SNARE family protein [Heterostelium album PN500]|eukprot:XP_020428249.1 t-SNARE family protein [Heterostelium album PN500]